MTHVSDLRLFLDWNGQRFWLNFFATEMTNVPDLLLFLDWDEKRSWFRYLGKLRWPCWLLTEITRDDGFSCDKNGGVTEQRAALSLSGSIYGYVDRQIGG